MLDNLPRREKDKPRLYWQERYSFLKICTHKTKGNWVDREVFLSLSVKINFALGIYLNLKSFSLTSLAHGYLDEIWYKNIIELW